MTRFCSNPNCMAFNLQEPVLQCKGASLTSFNSSSTLCKANLQVESLDVVETPSAHVYSYSNDRNWSPLFPDMCLAF